MAAHRAKHLVRSPLLSSPPPDRAAELQHRRQLRSISLGGCVAVLLLLGVPVMRRLTLSEEIIRVLYELHDRLLLPLYGYTVTLFHPISYSWLLALGGFLLLGLGGFALARPPWRSLHIALLRQALRYERPRQLLLRWCTRRWLPRFGTGMLRTVVEYDCRTALLRLETAEPPGDGEAPRKLVALAEQAVRLVVLQGKLAPQQAAQRSSRLAALAEVLPPLLLLLCPRDPAESRLSPHLLQLVDAIGEVLQTRPSREHHSPAGGSEPTRCFAAPLLEEELQAVLDHLRSAQPAQPGTPSALAPVLAGIRQRRSVIDSLRRQLEHRLLLGVAAAAPGYTQIERLPGGTATGRLALVLTMAVATLCRAPELAAAYLDSLDALWFMLQATEMPRGDLPPDDPAAVAEWLCEALPRPSDYRICARLLDERLAADRDVLAATADSRSIIDRRDLELVRDRINRLLAAAADPGQSAAGLREAS